MEPLKKYRLFERGDGVEEEEEKSRQRPLIKRQVKQLEFDFNQAVKKSKNLDYILGLPSGEVVLVDDVNDMKLILDRRLAEWTHSFGKTILNCYATSDKNLEKIKSIIQFLKREKVGQTGYKEICQEFIDEMVIITGRKYICAFCEERLTGTNRYRPLYTLIVPDINTNWNNFYKDIFTDMTAVIGGMRKKYTEAHFAFGPNISSESKDIKYYGLPEDD